MSIPQVYAWGDNDHGQQGNGSTTVNRKPALVHGLEGVKVWPFFLVGGGEELFPRFNWIFCFRSPLKRLKENILSLHVSCIYLGTIRFFQTVMKIAYIRANNLLKFLILALLHFV